MKTFASLFSGFGGADIGAKRLGLEYVWGIELQEKIADVAIQNGHDLLVKNILDVNVRKLEPADILHASPPCPNFSQAKNGAEESELDIALSKKICEFIETLQPKAFTLENVRGYLKSESFERIINCLKKHKYHYNYWILNSANYGVPQSRVRLMLAASKEFKPSKPEPSHCKTPDNLFQSPWMGWYEAIEDLLNTLPKSEFAPWQIKRLSEVKYFQNLLIPRPQHESTNRSKCRTEQQPAPTQTSTGSRPTAYLIHGANSNANGKRHVCADSHGRTISAGDGLSHKALFFNNQQRNGVLDMREGEAPAPTVLASSKTTSAYRAYLVDGMTSSNGQKITTRVIDEPSMTIAASQEKRPLRAWLEQGRVVKMTPRAIARFQDFPDTYELPEQKSLACQGLGNAVPPTLQKVVLETIIK